MAAPSSTMDLTAANAVLKELYGVQQLEYETYQDRPTLALISKREDSGGKLIPLPVQYNDGPGASADYTKVETGTRAEEFATFQLVGKTMHHKAVLTGDAIASARGDKTAFVDLIKNSVKSKINALANDCAIVLFGGGTGTIGVVGSIHATNGTLTLATTADAVKFTRGQVLQATDTDGGTAVAALGYVIAVNRNTGVLTITDSASSTTGTTPTGWSAVNYPYLVTYGNLNSVAKGIPAWCPSSAPDSTAFLGVDRSVDSLLYGGFINGSGLPAEEAIIKASVQQYMNGGKCDAVICNPLKWGSLALSMGQRVRYTEVKGPAQVSFTGIVVATRNGPVTVLADRYCPYSDCFMLDMDSWKMFSVGKVPQVNQTVTGGLEWIPVPGYDRAEIRFEARLMAIGCTRPGHNMRIYNFGE